MTPDHILGVLRREGDDARRASIDRVVEACDSLARNGRIKFVDIEKFIKSRYGAHVGSRAQTISNEKSRKIGLYHYIEARNRDKSAKSDTSDVTFLKLVEQAVEKIPAMDTRHLLRDVIMKWKLAEESLSRAKHVLKSFYPGLDVSAYLAGSASNPPANSGVDAASIDALRSALSILTDETSLSRCGLTFDDGLVRRKSGTCEQLLPRRVIKGLKGLIEQLSS